MNIKGKKNTHEGIYIRIIQRGTPTLQPNIMDIKMTDRKERGATGQPEKPAYTQREKMFLSDLGVR